MQTAADISLLLVVILFILRLPSVLTKPTALPAWLSSGFAILGLLTLGFVIPLDVVDGLMGGTNLWNLAEAAAATCAFWFMYRAMGVIVDQRLQRTKPWIPGAMITSFSVPFFLIQDRGSTSAAFVDEHISQFACWLYLTMYLIGVGAIAAASLWRIRPVKGGTYVLFRVGYAAVILSIPTDIIYLSLTGLGLADTGSREIVWTAFTVCFYSGVFSLAAGFFILYAKRVVRRPQPVWRLRALRMWMIVNRLENSCTTLRGAQKILWSPEPAAEAYSGVVRIRDNEIFDGARLSPTESSAVEKVEGVFARMPRFQQMAGIYGSSELPDGKKGGSEC